MKSTIKAIVLAFIGISVNLHAATPALPAPLPEFMNQQQLDTWNAQQASAARQTVASSQEDSTQFYTGKPYVADAGGYVYKYRTYNPEMSRWTSADPSGFPDGPNNHVYAPKINAQVDSDGRMTVNGTTSVVNTPVTGSFPGFFSAAAYSGIAYATADGTANNPDGSGTLNLSSLIDGYTFSTPAPVSVNLSPVINVFTVGTGLEYDAPSGANFGTTNGVVGAGLYVTVDGVNTQTLTFHVWASYAENTTSVSGIGIGTSGASISFSSGSVTQGPISLGTFVFQE